MLPMELFTRLVVFTLLSVAKRKNRHLLDVDHTLEYMQCLVDFSCVRFLAK